MDVLQSSKGFNNQGLMNLFDSFMTAIRHMCFVSPGLAIGSVSTAKVKIVNTTTYVIAGVFKSKTSAEVAFTATTHDIAANASTVQEAVYLVSLDGAGAPALTMGAIASGSGAAKLPNVPANQCPIGYVRVAVAAGSTKFDASTDALDATHLTVAYVNLAFLHPRFDAAQ